MKNKIELENGNCLYYGKGNFDDWCIYKIDNKGIKTVPKDKEIFIRLKDFALIYGNEKVYEDILKFYEKTTNKVEENVLKLIKMITKNYNNLEVLEIYIILYMAMISEGNKKNTKLGKRIKMLGIYNLLIENKTPDYCANFMKKKSAVEIDKLCIEGGF